MRFDLSIFIALLAGHVLGEMLWDGSVAVRTRRWRRGVLVTICVLATSYVVLGVWTFWPVVVMAGMIWGVVRITSATWPDSTKAWMVRQLGALALIGLSAWIAREALVGFYVPGISFWPKSVLQFLVGVVGLVASVWLGGSFMNHAIRPFAVQMGGPEVVEAGGRVIEPLKDGFKNGGQVIGFYERLLIFLFVLANAPTAIGFLIAAKSVFRFGDLNDSTNRKNAEYIIIGTLMSFAYALVTAYGTRYLLTLLGEN